MARTTRRSESGQRDARSTRAEHRLSVLELARELGNVAEACRQRGLDRTSFSEWRRRFRTQGFDGLKDLPPIHKSHPQTTPPETVERIKELALEHPAYGCNRLEAMLALEGRRVSSITVQKILNDNALGTRHDRWLALGAQATAGKARELNSEQVAFLERRSANVMSRARRQASCCQPIRASSVPSRAWARSLCMRWSTPTAPTPSASCMARSSPRPLWRSCTTTCCPAIGGATDHVFPLRMDGHAPWPLDTRTRTCNSCQPCCAVIPAATFVREDA